MTSLLLQKWWDKAVRVLCCVLFLKSFHQNISVPFSLVLSFFMSSLFLLFSFILFLFFLINLFLASVLYLIALLPFVFLFLLALLLLLSKPLHLQEKLSIMRLRPEGRLAGGQVPPSQVIGERQSEKERESEKVWRRKTAVNSNGNKTSVISKKVFKGTKKGRI